MRKTYADLNYSQTQQQQPVAQGIPGRWGCYHPNPDCTLPDKPGLGGQVSKAIAKRGAIRSCSYNAKLVEADERSALALAMILVCECLRHVLTLLPIALKALDGHF